MIYIFYVYDTDFSLTHQLFNKHIHNIENSSFIKIDVKIDIKIDRSIDKKNIW